MKTIILGLICLTFCSSFLAANDQLRDLIDQEISQVWKERNVSPAGKSNDSEFLRRVYLDLLGVIPTLTEAEAFIANPDPHKREKLIDQLLEHPRFGVHQSDVWDQVFFGRNPPGYGTRERDGFKNWLRKQFDQNVPYHVWAKQILLAEGNTVEQGVPMFYVQYSNAPEDATESITQKFLGVQLQCARCHDHPFDSWSQEDFYGMAAFLARLRVVNVGKKNNLQAFAIGELNKGEVLFTGPVSQDEPGKKGKAVRPKFLDGQTLAEPKLPKDFKEPRNFPSGKMPAKPEFSRKEALAQWMTDPDNPYFARAVANRIWAQFMGKGIVDPVDNLSPDNPPSHPELLDLLTKHLKDHQFDLKWLIKEIVCSQTYQRAGGHSSTDAKTQWYQRARVRPLSAEELFESWLIASGYDQVALQSGSKLDLLNGAGPINKERFRVRGITWDYLRRAFGQPEDGAGNFQGGLQEHLYLNNGQVRQIISTRKGSLHYELMQSKEPLEKRVQKLFLQILSRMPTAQEQLKFVEFLSAKEDATGRMHDAIWTLMSCSEFRFNH